MHCFQGHRGRPVIWLRETLLSSLLLLLLRPGAMFLPNRKDEWTQSGGVGGRWQGQA